MPDDERLSRYGKAIWEASRADEGTISYAGANIVAKAVMAVADAEMAAPRRSMFADGRRHALIKYAPCGAVATLPDREGTEDCAECVDFLNALDAPTS